MNLLPAVVGIILFIPMGITMLRHPDRVWEFQHMFTVKNGEPTDFALLSIRIGGGCLLAVAALCAVLLFFI